jgi:hypothetical protein
MHSLKLLTSVIVITTLAILASAYFSVPLSFETPDILGAEACTSFSYGGWTSCLNGIQTRPLIDSSPLNCDGGNPETERRCTICTEFVYSEWSACRNSTQIRSITQASPIGCIGGIADLTRECNAGQLLMLVVMTKPNEARLLTSETEMTRLNAQGYHLQEHVGYIYTEGGNQTTALYSLHNPKSKAQFYTTSLAEKDNYEKKGYFVDIVGYVFKEDTENMRALFAFQSTSGLITYTADAARQLELIQANYKPLNVMGYVGE